ncbi:MAG: Crp/Fnr family transcriptional regulator [Myxococcota bacterium]|nr:Crp/Fnr family transcriptional regulator [Myxococcota bacterium]
MDNKAALLRNVDIFSGLSPELTEQLVRSLNSISLKKNTLIFGKDSDGDGLYIIRSGQVKVVLQNEEGKEIILATFQPGDFFGEMSLLDGRPRSANVFTTQNTQLLVLSRQSLFQHIEQYPTTGLKILMEMSSRLRRADEVIGNLVMLDAYGRVARVLIDLSEQQGEVTEEGILIKDRPTQQDMASMIGTTRETVSRILSDFQKRGLLSTEGKTILLSHGFMEAVHSRL